MSKVEERLSGAGGFIRAIGGATALALAVFQLRALGYGTTVAVALSTLWLATIVAAGRWRLFPSVWREPYSPQHWSSDLDWGSAFWGGVLATLAIGVSSGEARQAAAALTPPLLVCYAMGKLSCVHHRCCDWATEREGRRAVLVTLPAVECMSAVFLLGVSIALREPAAIIFAFAVGHGLVRAMSVRGQRRAPSLLTAILHPAGGLTALYGLLLVV
jgi:hypothetical protein